MSRTALLLAVWALLAALAGGCGGSRPQVADVRWSVDENTRLVVTYELRGELPAYSVGLAVSLDNGRTFELTPRALSGDCGPAVSPGARRMLWDVFSDTLNISSQKLVIDVRAATAGGKSSSGRSAAAALTLELIPKVMVPAGTYRMGSAEDEPGREADEKQHEIEFPRPFLLGATEVTQDQWRRVMGSYPSYFANCGPDCPVEQVSWYDALRFCNELSTLEGLSPCYSFADQGVTWDRECSGYHLPTEAQWEYAARAGSAAPFAHGGLGPELLCEAIPALAAFGWYCGNSGVDYTPCYQAPGWGMDACSGVQPVGQKNPNAWGLYDMHGNIAEWTWDRYQPEYEAAAVVDPSGPDQGEHRTIRGGSWISYARACRSADRDEALPEYTSSGLGLRLARRLP